jgi:tetratricopeptide (TPR) repeat protein
MNRLPLLLLTLSLALPAAAQNPSAAQLAPPKPAPPTAKALNSGGFELYKAGKYAEALEKFQAAVQADPKHALARYNVAATLGVLRKQGQICQHSAHRETILEQLKASVKLDPKRLQRAKEDADLDPIRDTVGWQQLLGRSPARAADVPELLRKVSWFGPGVGVYGTLVTIKFEDGNKVTVTKKVPQEEGAPKTETITGTYSVKGRNVEVKLTGQPPDTGSLDTKGVLKLKSLGTFYDSPSECEA